MSEIHIDKIIRSKRKSIALVIAPEGTLLVRAPFSVSLRRIKNIVSEKRAWIEDKILFVKKNNTLHRKKEYLDGEDFLFLGKSYKLKIVETKHIELLDYLVFPKKYLNKPQAKMIKWYREQAWGVFSERANYYGELTGWKHKSLKVNSARTRWGSCGANGSLNFTWRLIMAPLEIVDYVVVHELAHIVERNHSAKFWAKVKMVLPDYKARQKWLKEQGRLLHI